MGCFIVFEGVDHSGKTTLIHHLIAKLRKNKFQVASTIEPGGTQLGKEIRKILLKSSFHIDPLSETLLFLSDRIQHWKEKLEPLLATMDVVICDRYFYSTFVYQGLYKKVNFDLILNLHQQLGIFNKIPDLVFFLNSQKEQLLLQRRQQTIRQSDFDDRFHQQLKTDYFSQMQKFYTHMFIKLEKYFVHLEKIDTNQEFSQTLEQVYQIILKKCLKTPRL